MTTLAQAARCTSSTASPPPAPPAAAASPPPRSPPVLCYCGAIVRNKDAIAARSACRCRIPSTQVLRPARRRASRPAGRPAGGPAALKSPPPCLSRRAASRGPCRNKIASVVRLSADCSAINRNNGCCNGRNKPRRRSLHSDSDGAGRPGRVRDPRTAIAVQSAAITDAIRRNYGSARPSSVAVAAARRSQAVTADLRDRRRRPFRPFSAVLTVKWSNPPCRPSGSPLTSAKKRFFYDGVVSAVFGRR